MDDVVIGAAEGRLGKGPMSILAEGQTMPEAFMVSLCGCFATITVLHTASRRKKSMEF